MFNFNTFSEFISNTSSLMLNTVKKYTVDSDENNNNNKNVNEVANDTLNNLSFYESDWEFVGSDGGNKQINEIINLSTINNNSATKSETRPFVDRLMLELNLQLTENLDLFDEYSDEVIEQAMRNKPPIYPEDASKRQKRDWVADFLNECKIIDKYDSIVRDEDLDSDSDDEDFFGNLGQLSLNKSNNNKDFIVYDEDSDSDDEELELSGNKPNNNNNNNIDEVYPKIEPDRYVFNNVTVRNGIVSNPEEIEETYLLARKKMIKENTIDLVNEFVKARKKNGEGSSKKITALPNELEDLLKENIPFRWFKKHSRELIKYRDKVALETLKNLLNS